MADISRADALALINKQDTTEIFQEAAKYSVALSSFPTRNMGTKQTRLRIIDVLPTAGFVTGDTGRKPTTEQVWANKEMEAEEIACIVPIPENVFDDVEANVWEEIRPRIAEAFGLVLDGAVFFGTNKPSTWPEGIAPLAIAAGNTVERGTLETGVGLDLAYSFSELLGVVEEDGYEPTDVWTRRAMRRKLRTLRDANGDLIYAAGLKQAEPAASIWDANLKYVRNASWVQGATNIQAIAGDASKAIIGLRQDITYKILTEATLTDGAGNVVFSLAEQDMIALRAKMRVAYQVVDPTTVEGGGSAFPFAVMRQTAS